jgi:hypothetical protein
MPGRDQTGPNGMGPFTGRGMGVRRGGGGFGYGFNGGFRRGGGSGRGYGLHRNFYEEDYELSQKEYLENELRIMKEQVARLEEQLQNK